MSFFEFPHTRTYDSDLGWLIKDYKHITELIDALNQWKAETDPKIEDMQALLDQIVHGDFPDEMKTALYNWVVENTVNIIGGAIKAVFFGLENGYLVAYIPESWDEITFGTTGLDDFVAGQDFGHLTLTY